MTFCITGWGQLTGERGADCGERADYSAVFPVFVQGIGNPPDSPGQEACPTAAAGTGT